MSQVQFEIDLTEWFIQGTFIAAIIFAVVYIPFFRWRETITGRATTTLVLAIAGALFRSVLVIWGVIDVTVKGPTKNVAQEGVWSTLLTWLSIFSLGAACVSIAALAFVAIRYLIAESETTNPLLCKLFHLGVRTEKENA